MWYTNNTLARELCQLDEREYRKFADTDLLDANPVVLPRPEYVVGANDYFMWPIATMVDETIVVLYQRTPCHWGPDKEKSDDASGIRMVVRSSDGGRTWSRPVDILESGARWTDSPFKGFGGGLGAHDGIVYAALNEGLYRSADRGATWSLASSDPVFDGVPSVLWAPGMRITFDDDHGLIVWTTSGFSEDPEHRKTRGEYGTHLVAVYSPDSGTTWRSESQRMPEGLRLSEVTPAGRDRSIAFFLRNGLRDTYFGQGFSRSGWFPFRMAVSNVGPVAVTDTPDLSYNPATERWEAAAPHRDGLGPGPQGGMKVNLYSIDEAALEAGSPQWRFEGTLIRYRGVFGRSDGFNVVGSVIDRSRNLRNYHVWGGDCTGAAGIFQYSVSLDTHAVNRYLSGFYQE